MRMACDADVGLNHVCYEGLSWTKVDVGSNRFCGKQARQASEGWLGWLCDVGYVCEL